MFYLATTLSYNVLNVRAWMMVVDWPKLVARKISLYVNTFTKKIVFDEWLYINIVKTCVVGCRRFAYIHDHKVS